MPVSSGPIGRLGAADAWSEWEDDGLGSSVAMAGSPGLSLATGSGKLMAYQYQC